MNTILRTLLYEWQERKLPNLIKRDINIPTSQSIINNATVITGFRRVGKTYLLYQVIEELLKNHSKEEIVYLNFEDERITQPTTDLLTDLIPEVQTLFGEKPKYLFLDELQLVPNWSKWVRRILDSESINVFITGSSSKMSSGELATELRGRAWEFEVHPLKFAEFLHFKDIKIDFEKVDYLKQEMSRFDFLFEEYLLYGGLPAVVLTEKERKLELLQSYFQTVVQRDIAERYNIENDIALRTLLKLLLNSSLITISKLHNNLKSMGIAVGKSTVDNYLSHIESSYFMKEVYIFNPSVKNQLQYPRKVYFIDTGFMTALSTKFSKNIGRLFENMVFQKLSHLHETIHYYQDQGSEVDFVILEDGKVSALYQVCVDLTDEETRKRDVKAILKAAKKLHCSKLYLVTMDRSKVRIPQEIEVITPEKLL